MLWTLFIPVLAQKALVEERHQKTWEALLTTGVDVSTLVLAKFCANVVQIVFWMLLCLVFPVVLSRFIAVDVSILLCSMSVMVSLGMHWLALCYGVLCKTKSFVVAYFKAGGVLLLYFLFPLLVVLWPDPYYRPIFETLDLRGILDRASQGIVLAHDLVWLWGATALFLAGTILRLNAERSIGLQRLKALVSRSVYIVGCGFALIFAMMICHSRSWMWDMSSQRQGQLSVDYQRLVAQFPTGIKITLALPARWNAPSYEQSRGCLVTFMQKTQARAKGMEVEILDPDVDQAAMERLRASGGKSDNKIGFVSIALNGDRINIPYHQWVSLGTMTIDNEPHRYLHAFNGEDQLVRAVNQLTQSRIKGKVLVMSGQGELELDRKDNLGGSEFLDLVQQFGLDVIRYKPDIDATSDMKGVKLLLLLDSQSEISPASQTLLRRAFDEQIPVLACRGPANKRLEPKAFEVFKDYGMIVSTGVIYQRHYRQYPPFTLPMAEFSNHPVTNELQGRVILFDYVCALSEGISADPRLKVVPLLRTQAVDSIWDEYQYDPKEPMVQHQFGSLDKASPLYTAMAAEWMTEKGRAPALVLFGTRSIFQNGWIHQGANRELLFQALDWVLHTEDQVHLPASLLANYRIEARPSLLLWLQLLITGLPPLLLLAVGFMQWKKRY